MIKIMFVCHGNICRSPMAEIVFKRMVEEAGLSDRICVSSAATSTEELGNPIYPPAREELAKRGYVPDKGKHAVQLRRDDYALYDLFVAMDRQNLYNMKRIFGEDPQNKMKLLMSYTENGGEVADPWFSYRFDIAFEDIYMGCHALLERILQNDF